VNGTYQATTEVAGKIAWENNNMRLFFSDTGVYNTWILHNEITEDYLVYVTDYPSKGDSFPPLGTPSLWQLFSDAAVVPGDYYVWLVIAYQETCNPSQVPTKAPTEAPTLGPTEIYLCIIVTWDLSDSSFSAIPEDFYGAYYSNNLIFLANNEFSKFPIYPSTRNDKLVFTKKRNDNTVSFFLESDDPVDANTWVIDSDDHTSQLVSSEANEGSDYPRFTDFPEGSLVTPPAEYNWTLYEDGVQSSDHVIRVELSREMDTCERFDTDTPTTYPTGYPTRSPSPSPSIIPTPLPSPMPSSAPTTSPSPAPSLLPSPSPTFRPTSQLPTQAPTPFPTQYPTLEYECVHVTVINLLITTDCILFSRVIETAANGSMMEILDTTFTTYRAL